MVFKVTTLITLDFLFIDKIPANYTLKEYKIVYLFTMVVLFNFNTFLTFIFGYKNHF